MKKLNIVEQAKIAVTGFDQVEKKLEQQVVLRGQDILNSIITFWS